MNAPGGGAFIFGTFFFVEVRRSWIVGGGGGALFFGTVFFFVEVRRFCLVTCFTPLLLLEMFSKAPLPLPAARVVTIVNSNSFGRSGNTTQHWSTYLKQ
jgi:hypothetical protein